MSEVEGMKNFEIWIEGYLFGYDTQICEGTHHE